MRRILLALSIASAALAGCGTDSDPPPPEDPGAAAVQRGGCADCHGGPSLGGSDTPVTGSMTYGPNLTPDEMTGLAGWTDEQIIRAIRTGIDDEGAPLCPTMPRYDSMTDEDARLLVRYLRSIPPVSHDAPHSVCEEPPADGGDDAPSPDVTEPDVMPLDTGVDASVDVPIDVRFDAGTDARLDAAMDARVDAAMDARVDAAMDARADVRTDVAADVRTDVATDARTDASIDARVDAATDARTDATSDVPVDVPPLGCHPVINEMVTGVTSAATNEWIELYNPCTAAINITGWRIGYRGATTAGPLTAADSQTLFTFPARTIAPMGYLLIAGTGYTGTVDGRLSTGVADPGGGIGLRNTAGTVVDSLGWGTATNAFVRVRPSAVAPLAAAPGNSIQRLPDGADTGNNMADFHISMRPTPRGANR
ncbi:MAG: lamin tail domain-containing protein [Polyangiales bacterium]